MRTDSINMQIQEIMDKELQRVLLSSLSTYIILTLLLVSFVYCVYVIARKDIDTTSRKERNIRYFINSIIIVVSLSTMASFSYLFIQEDITTKQAEFEKYKTTSQYSDVKYKLDTIFWNYDLEVELENYIADLPTQKTKEYTDFNYTNKGIEFYFKGKLRTTKNTNLFTLVEGKKPILLYKEIDNDIYGIHKKGDIVDIKFITNY